jgi:hypothetical protein
MDLAPVAMKRGVRFLPGAIEGWTSLKTRRLEYEPDVSDNSC